MQRAHHRLTIELWAIAFLALAILAVPAISAG